MKSDILNQGVNIIKNVLGAILLIAFLLALHMAFVFGAEYIAGDTPERSSGPEVCYEKWGGQTAC